MSGRDAFPPLISRRIRCRPFPPGHRRSSRTSARDGHVLCPQSDKVVTLPSGGGDLRHFSNAIPGSGGMEFGHPKWFIDEFQRRRRQLTRLVGPGVCAAIVMFAIAYYFVEPAPPATVEIATGTQGALLRIRHGIRSSIRKERDRSESSGNSRIRGELQIAS